MPQVISRYKSATKALISLGSNVATDVYQPAEMILAGLEMLEKQAVRVTGASRLFATPCVPAGAGPDYVNAAAAVSTDLAPEELLSHLQDVEQEFDRRRLSRWGARTLDLDLLDYGGVVQPDLATWQTWHDLPFDRQRQETPEHLILPHPRLQDRAFVLVPLAEIAADWTHPVLGRTVTQMCQDLGAEALSGIVPLDTPESLALSVKGR